MTCHDALLSVALARITEFFRRMNMKPLHMILAALLCTSATVVAQSDTQKSFDKLKALQGSWNGSFEGKPMQATLRVTSRGNAIVHEMKGEGPDDPITMFYLDGDQLLLTHYCDAGNRPRMAGKISPDGKTIEFDLLDVANYNSAQHGHMQHAVFTLIDENHHTEEWTFMMEGKPAMKAHLDFQRAK
jgi:hypothetical protein